MNRIPAAKSSETIAGLPRTDRDAVFRWLAACLAGVFLLLVIPEWHPRFREIGLDASWIATLQHFAHTDLQFGTELIYTYGPLGYLATIPGAPRVFREQVIWHLFLALALTVGIARMMPVRAGPWNLLLGAVYCFAIALRPVDNHVVGLVLLAVTATRTKARPSGAEILLVLALSVGSLLKLTLLAVGLVAVAAAAVLNWLAFRRLSPMPAIFVGSVLALWLAAGQRLGSWGPYLRNGWEIASGYTETMSQPGPDLAALGFVVCYLLVLIASRVDGAGRWSFSAWILFAAGATILFSAFKLGFVRHQGPRCMAAWQALIVFALVALLIRLPDRPADQRAFRAGYLALGICLASLAAPLFLHYPEAPMSLVFGRLSQVVEAPVRILRHLKRPQRMERLFEARQESVRSAFPLPPITGTVDLYGGDSAIAIAHGLPYTPRPVFQSFAAYTPRLSRINGEFYRGPSAPETVLARPLGFAGAPASFVDAEAMLELYRNYELTSSTPDLLVLSRSPGRRDLVRGPARTVTAKLGEWIPVPELESSVGVWAEIEIRRTLLGEAGAALFKLPQMAMTLRFETGDDISFTFSPRGGAGLMLSPVVFNYLELEPVLTRGLSAAPRRRRPTAFRIEHREGGGEWARKEMLIRLTGLVEPAPPQLGPSEPPKGDLDARSVW